MAKELSASQEELHFMQSVCLSVRSSVHLQVLMASELCGSVTDKLRVVQLVTNFPTFT